MERYKKFFKESSMFLNEIIDSFFKDLKRKDNNFELSKVLNCKKYGVESAWKISHAFYLKSLIVGVKTTPSEEVYSFFIIDDFEDIDYSEKNIKIKNEDKFFKILSSKIEDFEK